MRILGIETSCDETAAAIVEDGHRVLANVIASSWKEQAAFGGVFPEVAARRQVEYIVPVIEKAIQVSGVRCQDIDAIAVTRGPGLLTSLLVGTMAARTLAAVWKKPLIGVHHTLGHLDSPWLEQPKTPLSGNHQYTSILIPSDPPVFPVLTLSVSGGHTDLWLRRSHHDGTLLGSTLDDAAGEAFDKGAVLFGLPYPGGPALAALAEGGNPQAFSFPIPLQGRETLDMSFSGLKTSLKYTLRDLGGLSALAEKERRDLAASYQEAICHHLVSRIAKASELHPEVREVHLVGGVSANRRLRILLQELVRSFSTFYFSLFTRWPSAIEYCTDNAAMIAAAGYFLAQELGERACLPFETEASPQASFLAS